MRRPLAVLLALLVGIALAGCGKSESARPVPIAGPDDPLSEIAEKKTAPGQKAAKATTTGARAQGSSAAAGQPKSKPAAKVDLAAFASRLAGRKSTGYTLSATTGADTVRADGTAAFGPPLGFDALTDVPAIGRTTVRQAGGEVYAQVPDAYRVYTGGKGWIRGTSGVDGGDELLGVLRQVDQRGPVGAVVKKGARTVGAESVGGAQANHYAGTLTAAELLASLPADQREARKQALAGATSVQLDFWVDAGGQLRRVKSVAGKSTVSIDYRDWDKPVSVSAPPANDVGQLAGG